MKALLLDPVNMEILYEVEVFKKKRIGDMYYRTDRGMIPIAYLFKPENHEQLEKCCHAIRKKREELLDFEYDYFNNVFPKLRI